MKINRAGEHLKSLHKDILAFVKRKPYRLVNQFKPHGREPREGRIIVEATEPVPEHFSVIAGDVIHNLRATLDHMVFELAVIHSGHPLKPEVEEGSQFPILGEDPDVTAKEKERRGKALARRIGAIHPDAQAVIETLQPYHRTHGFWERHPLWMLRELSNIDKHRALPLTLLIHHGAKFSAKNLRLESFESIGNRIEDGAPLFRYIASPIDPEAEVHVDCEIRTNVMFADVLVLPMGVTNVLGQIHRFITDDVIPKLRGFFVSTSKR